MNIIIIGAGKLGTALCARLENEGHNITVIDTNQAVCDRVVEDYDVMGFCENGMNVDALRQAHCNKTDVFIATTGEDEINMVMALFARKLGAKYVIARVRNPLYRKQTGFMREEMDINMTVNPEFDSACEIARMLKFPEAAKIETFAKGRIEMAEVRVEEESNLCDKSLSEISKRIKSGALICAVERGEKVVIPNGDFIIRSGDRVNITATHAQLANFLKESGIITQKIRSVMVVGCGAIGFYLTKILTESGIKVKVLEKDISNCERVNNLIPKAEVVCADGTNHQVLIEEGLLTCDALVSLTGVDEENIIVSLFAKAKGVEKVITKVNNNMLYPIVGSLGLDSIITPKDIAADVVSAYVRAKKNAKNGEVLTLYKLAGGRLEALEFRVVERSEFIGKKLKDLTIRENAIIAGIAKGNKMLIPNGESVIEEGDRVMVVTTNAHIEDLSEVIK